MSAIEVMYNSPWLTFFLFLIVAQAVVTPFRLLFRHLNIRKAGWPPAYLDADGDRHEPETEPRP